MGKENPIKSLGRDGTVITVLFGVKTIKLRVTNVGRVYALSKVRTSDPFPPELPVKIKGELHFLYANELGAPFGKCYMMRRLLCASAPSRDRLKAGIHIPLFREVGSGLRRKWPQHQWWYGYSRIN